MSRNHHHSDDDDDDHDDIDDIDDGSAVSTTVIRRRVRRVKFRAVPRGTFGAPEFVRVFRILKRIFNFLLLFYFRSEIST
jgi:hypothetical protein